MIEQVVVSFNAVHTMAGGSFAPKKSSVTPPELNDLAWSSHGAHIVTLRPDAQRSIHNREKARRGGRPQSRNVVRKELTTDIAQKTTRWPATTAAE